MSSWAPVTIADEWRGHDFWPDPGSRSDLECVPSTPRGGSRRLREDHLKLSAGTSALAAWAKVSEDLCL